MKRSSKLKRFVSFQAIVLLITMFLCIFLSSFVSYHLIKDDQLELDLATGGVYLNYCSNLLETKVVSASREIYSQLLTNLYSNEYFNFYIENSPFEKSNISYLYDSSYVTKHLLSIRESNELLREVGIFYIDNQMLISSSEVKYDAYFEFRKDELAQFNQIVSLFASGSDTTAASVIDNSILRICRPVWIGSRIETLIILDFSIHDITACLQPYLWDTNVDILLLNADGLILADTSAACTGRMFTESPYFSEDIALTDSGYYVNAAENGENVINFVTRGSYSYLSVIPTTRYTDSADFLLTNIVISFLVSLGVGLLLSVIVALLQSRGMGSVLNLIDTTAPDLKVKTDVYELIRTAYTKMINTVEVQSEQLASIIPALQEKFVLWFFSRMPSDADEIRDNMEMMRVEYKHPHFVVLAVKPERTEALSELPDDYDIEFGFSELLDNLKKQLNTDHTDVSFCRKENTLWGIVNFDGTYDALIRSLETIDVPSSSCELYFSIGAAYPSLAPLSKDIPAIDAGLGYSFLYPDRKVCTGAQFAACEAVPASEFAVGFKQILKTIRRGDGEAANRELDAFIESIRAKGCNLSELKQMLADIVSELKKYDATALRMELEQCPNNIFAYCAVLKRYMERELQKDKLDPISTGKLAVLARAYVDEHLTDNQISLQYVADQLGANAAYLSAVFAATYDVTFIEYLTQCRIEYAKDLLANTDKPLAEIAELLSYSSSKYFISRFKACCGMTPTVYRRQYKETKTQEQTE